MSSYSISRRVTTFRCAYEAPPEWSCVETEAEVSNDSVSALCVKTPPKLASNRKAEVAARRACERLSESLPRPRLRGLFVEAGRVEQTVKCGAHKSESECRMYLLAACCGEVLSLVEGGSAELDCANVAPCGVFEPCEVSGDLPVTFGASAVLALICHYLEVLDAGDAPAGWRRLDPQLSTFESSWSPYPPHSLPRSLTGRVAARGRGVIVGGEPVRERAPQSSAPFIVHPKRWCGPRAALFNDALMSPRVCLRREARSPARALHVGSLVPLKAAGGVTEWEAELTLREGGALKAVAASPALLCFDAADVLKRAGGCIGAPSAALADDPITGELYGVAPALATDVRAAELSSAFS